MKKLLIAIICLLPFVASANEQEKYMKGTVPEVDGVVVFTTTVDVQSLTKEQAIQRAADYIQKKLMEPAIHQDYTRMLSDGKADGVVVARVEEYMVFRNVFLNLDRTRFRYMITAEYKNGQMELKLTQISYYYNEDQEGDHGINYKAEEWITDKLAINKKGTKLYPRSGKFRRKTIDRVEAIFEGARLELNQR